MNEALPFAPAGGPVAASADAGREGGAPAGPGDGALPPGGAARKDVTRDMAQQDMARGIADGPSVSGQVAPSGVAGTVRADAPMTSQPGSLAGPVIAVVVVTFNRLDHLRQTVARLLDEPLDHLVVVDSGSTDGSRDWLRGQDDPRLVVIELSRNGGGALGFETGMREARARFDPDWMILMDDDARPVAGALMRFREGLAEGRWGDAEALAAAVHFPDGRICEMNRPWVNPFDSAGVFLRVLAGGGRGAFHIPDAAFSGPAPTPIDGTSFVGFFISRAGVTRAGYPDGRLFIYGDDVLYTLGLSQAGGRILFAPDLGFEHDCTTPTAGAVFRPLWKTYYHHRNLWFVYRKAAGPWLFAPLMTLILPKWLIKGSALPTEERRIYRRLIRLAIRDAIRGRKSRSHEEILTMVG